MQTIGRLFHKLLNEAREVLWHFVITPCPFFLAFVVFFAVTYSFLFHFFGQEGVPFVGVLIFSFLATSVVSLLFSLFILAGSYNLGLQCYRKHFPLQLQPTELGYWSTYLFTYETMLLGVCYVLYLTLRLLVLFVGVISSMEADIKKGIIEEESVVQAQKQQLLQP